MAKEPYVSTTIGRECGCCGHRHRSVPQAGRCLAEHRQQNSPIGAWSLWQPTRRAAAEGRDLNHEGLDALYANAYARAEASEHERLARAVAVAADVAAVRRVADALYVYGAWAEGGFGRDTTGDAEIAAAGCRVIGLALATVETVCGFCQGASSAVSLMSCCNLRTAGLVGESCATGSRSSSIPLRAGRNWSEKGWSGCARCHPRLCGVADAIVPGSLTLSGGLRFQPAEMLGPRPMIQFIGVDERLGLGLLVPLDFGFDPLALRPRGGPREHMPVARLRGTPAHEREPVERGQVLEAHPTRANLCPQPRAVVRDGEITTTVPQLKRVAPARGLADIDLTLA